MENNRKDPRRQLIGAVSKALGQQFERDINAAFDHYRRLGVASIEKTPEPFHMTGRENGGKVVGFYEKKAQPDYAGTLRGGRSVYMEAKFTGSNRMEQLFLWLGFVLRRLPALEFGDGRWLPRRFCKTAHCVTAHWRPRDSAVLGRRMLAG